MNANITSVTGQIPIIPTIIAAMKIRGVTDTTRNICTVAKILKKRKIDMREIIFRGQNPRSKEWIYGYFNGLENSFARIIDTNNITRLVSPKTVGQYTGLCDKNGNKIFEGDIIQSIESGKTGEIQYFPEHTAFLIFVRCSVIDSRCYLDYLGEVKPSILKVIGNIHDNPELLNK